MSKRDGWKALFGLWANSLRRRKRPAERAPAPRAVRLEMLETRYVLTALVADVGTNVGIDGAYGLVEGGYDQSLAPTNLLLDGSLTTGDGPFTYEWDIDPNPTGIQPTIEDLLNPGNFIPNPLFVADFVNPPLSTPIVGATPTVTWAELNTRDITTGTPFLHDAIVSLRVTDSHNVVAIASGTLQVQNLPPFLSSDVTLTPTTVGCGQPAATLDLTFTDLNPTEDFAAYVKWDAANSSLETIEPVINNGDGTYTIHVTHLYDSAGMKSVQVNVKADFDQTFNFYLEDEFLGGGTVSVLGGGGGGGGSVALASGVLTVTGTCGNDWVHINAPPGNIRVQSNFLAAPLDFPVASVQSMVVLLGAGDDTLTVAGNVAIPLVAVGGDGNDIITGGRGGSILIGGKGEDSLYGGRGEDLLIGDYTSYDNNATALLAVLAEWTNPAHLLEDRIKNLVDGTGLGLGLNESGGYFVTTTAGSGQTVFDDFEADLLSGGASSDWLLLHPLDAAISDHRDLIGDDLNELFGP